MTWRELVALILSDRVTNDPTEPPEVASVSSVSAIPDAFEKHAGQSDTRRTKNRANFPTVAAWVDDVRAAFGDGIRVVWAIENGHTLGRPEELGAAGREVEHTQYWRSRDE